MPYVMSVACGVLFSLGLGISGMTQPQKVTGFLNILGDWDPSLLFVMVGALLVYFVSHMLVLRREAPLFGSRFALPGRSDIDRPLVLGAALFGTGWGLIGFCPGPALAALITGHQAVIIFVLAMTVGMYAFEVLDVRFSMEPDGGAGLIKR